MRADRDAGRHDVGFQQLDEFERRHGRDDRVGAGRQAFDVYRGADQGEVHAVLDVERDGAHLHVEHRVGAGGLASSLQPRSAVSQPCAWPSVHDQP